MAHRRSARLVLAAAGLAVLAACGTPSTPEVEEAGATAMEHQHHDQGQGQGQGQPPAQHQHGGDGLQLWATQTAALGIITLDGVGHILYRSDADANNPPASNCTGACTQRWTPVTVPDGQEPELLGIKPDQVGTLRRDDGTVQVTLAGWPLYTAAGDQGDHDGTGANGTDGQWFAITPTGEKAAP
jgi:predicted lipoprotein with Yx(FWY)xxD motif